MKRHLFAVLSIFCLCLYVEAQKNHDWENPSIFAINKENYRTTALPYPTEELAIIDEYSKSPYYISLDGIWKFNWVSKPSERPVDFYKENYDVNNWADLRVPSNWEFNGYGIPVYLNERYPFPKNPPFIDNSNNPVGSYRRNFDIPSDWDGRQVILHFDGGTAGMYVWVNGEKVGYTQNAKSPAEFDITKYIRKGKNTLACEVYKYSDGSYLEDQDMWRLAGINRSVYLYSTASTRIEDFFAHPELDANYKNGTLDLDIKLRNYANASENQQIDISLVDAAGKRILKKSERVTIPANNTLDINVSEPVKSPEKWTAETPNLYTLLITLKDKSGKIIETTSHKIGFRKIEMKDGQLFVNGKKVYFKGVNLHEFNANTGQVVDKDIMMRDLQLMKELNINAVRTSHYPQPPLWYKLCDEYGIYLVDEANMESHGLGYGSENVSYLPEWLPAHIDRITAVIERDKNHPSIILWSLGNESGNGTAFFEMYDWAKNRDKSRPVQYERAGRDRNTDIICPMYTYYDEMKDIAKTDLDRPFILQEYAHAMGNSMGNFQDYWDVMRSSKNMQGGFIWEWINHGYPAKDEYGREYWGYGGDFGGYNLINDGNFCIDGLISPDRQYTPHVHEVKKVYQDILFDADLNNNKITVINDHKFIPLYDNFAFKWVLLKNGEKIAEESFKIDVLADSRKEYAINAKSLPAMNFSAGNEYILQVFAYINKENNPKKLLPVGFEIAKEEFVYPQNNYFGDTKTNGITESITVEKSNNIAIVKSGNLSYEFSTKNGGNSLISFTNNGKRVFNNLPVLNFWRAPIDNDFGSNAQSSLRMWDAANKNIIYIYKGLQENANNVSITYTCDLKGIEANVDLTYTVNPDGSLTIDANYYTQKELPEMMRFGMIMTLPKSYNDFTWYGRGPWESYVDRKDAAFMSIWNGKVEDQAYPYIRPQETGNKMDVRWLTLTNSEGKGIMIKGGQPLSVSATNNRPEDLDPGLTKKQQHASDILSRNEVVLSVDLFQRGVAGTDSWGAKPLEKYQFKDKKYNYSYTISVIE